MRIFSRDHRIVVTAENPVRLDIYNVDGKLIHTGQNILGRSEVSVPTGNYVVKVTGENGKNISFKVVVS
ncbi:T9SS type A sorting domain-containing protein [uncultured Coprobacter sp.]|uniref:T9SS type A sorting domain-containing protein n=1 Tax=uncultured Coprobacter sp. TaxID=1720550 RepID=UPI0025E2A037|nr:T9SS type A sorting domain-containing protein [uncultured Coprobacter sp.]